MRILIYGAGVIGEKSMKNEEYKKLSIKEFTKAAGRYESNHAGIYEMCKKDYPDILEELEKEPFRDLLDAGCGPAPMISLLAEKHPARQKEIPSGISVRFSVCRDVRLKHFYRKRESVIVRMRRIWKITIRETGSGIM